jgi:hypothetical protein
VLSMSNARKRVANLRQEKMPVKKFEGRSKLICHNGPRPIDSGCPAVAKFT